MEEFCRKTNGGVSDVLKELHTLYGKYKVLETSLMQQKKALVTKIPQMKAAIKALAFLLKKQEGDEDTLTTHFELSDNVYAQAEIDASNDKVCLWLGANVMLEYTYEEAHALLTKNLAVSRTTTITTTSTMGYDQRVSPHCLCMNHRYRRLLRDPP